MSESKPSKTTQAAALPGSDDPASGKMVKPKPDTAFVTVAATVEVDGAFYGPGSYRQDALPEAVVSALAAAKT